MAEKSSFFNSVAGDRKYTATDFANYFNSLLTNGVFPNPSTNLQVVSNSNMTVTIKAGKAWINGYVYILDTDMVLTLGIADGILNRIDRIAIQFSTTGRIIKAVIKKGTLASTPVATVLQRDADIYELGIADIYITNGVTSITQANITDLRLNSDLCGIVNSLIKIDSKAIFDQYQAWFSSTSGNYNATMTANEAAFTIQFNTWFNTVQNTLNTDTAGNLLNKINALTTDNARITSSKTVTGAINELFTNASNGKVLIKNAITGKGGTLVDANNDGICTHQELANGVNTIKQGGGNAVESDVVNPKTFANADGVLRTGNIVDRGTVNITPSTVNQAITGGKHSGSGVVYGDANLIPSYILKDKIIFGVTGTSNDGSKLVAGEILWISHDAMVSQNGGEFIEKKRIKVNASGTVRIKFDLNYNAGNIDNFAGIAQIFVNGTARGILRSNSAVAFVTYSEDITVNTNDLVQLYLKTTSTSYYGQIKNFRLYQAFIPGSAIVEL